ncbi:MAG: choice-of-anchor H family protein [Woeseiaceae bacterium]
MKKLNRLKPVFSILLLSLLATAGQTALAAETDARVSVTTQGLVSERGAVPNGATHDTYDALTKDSKRSKQSAAAPQQAASANNAVAMNTEFWFYDAYVTLFADSDGDGYYTGIELEFDADTVYTAADVYAVTYLSLDYGPWHEYAVTADFTLYGASDADLYVIETELVTGYPAGDYDILIELYDTFDGSLVATFGPEDTSELSLLPLEDTTYDARPGTTTQVVINSGGGGSFSWLLLIGLTIVVAMRRIARRT